MVFFLVDPEGGALYTFLFQGRKIPLFLVVLGPPTPTPAVTFTPSPALSSHRKAPHGAAILQRDRCEVPYLCSQLSQILPKYCSFVKTSPFPALKGSLPLLESSHSWSAPLLGTWNPGTSLVDCHSLYLAPVILSIHI